MPAAPAPLPSESSEGDIIIDSVTQEQEGPYYHLRQDAQIRTPDLELRADEVDYNEQTGDVEARGNVQFIKISTGERLNCTLARYNLDSEIGQFFKVTGSVPAKIEARPGMLTSTNPYTFTGERAEKNGNRYTVHNGTLTDCVDRSPWWQLRGGTFDVIPQDRAIAHNSWVYLKKVPIFYAPFFYKSLKSQPRKSGFLTPNIGNSSLRGQTVGLGYFWAINRSYDLTYRSQYYSARGFAHQADFRGVPRQGTDFYASVFGIGEGMNRGNRGIQDGGYVITAEGKSQIGHGWEARGELRQLSSFAFRQQFTQSFDEAIYSETHSIGFLRRAWNGSAFNLVAQRNINYQSLADGDDILIRKLPEAQYTLRDHAIRNLPIYYSLDSSFGLESRTQPAFQTRQFVQRLDFAPRIMTALHWQGFDIAPSFALRETMYDSGVHNGVVTGQNVTRSARDLTVDIALPALTRIFHAPGWMRAGDQIKHVIEPRITYRNVSGIQNFNQVLRFDEVDLMSNTNEVEFSLTNRILQRTGTGGVSDLLSWQVWYKRYLDPTFGGAVVPGKRNVVESAVDITGYAYLNGPRNQSPVVSVLRVQTRVGIQWRADYDPVQKHIVNSGLSVDGRFGQLFTSIGHYQLRTDPVLAPNSNQLRGQVSWGGDNHRGFNYGFSTFYDYRLGQFQFMQSQVTYNTDCCGFSVQFRRFGFASRPENQFRVAFAISNIGSFGTLRRQERIF